MLEIEHFYYDWSALSVLCRKGNEGIFKEFTNSVFKQNTFCNVNTFHHRVIYTWYSFLESIGMGRFKEKNKFIVPEDFLSDFCTDPGAETATQNKENILQAPKKLISLAAEHYKNHPQLTRENLLKKIDDQREWLSGSEATTLLSTTLWRRRQEIDKEYDQAICWIAMYLGWDDACGYDYLKLDQIPLNKRTEARKRLREIRQALLMNLHEGYINGHEIGSYRLVDSIHRELLTTPEIIQNFEQATGKKVVTAKYTFGLDPKHDLGDTDVIHYATLGHYSQHEKAFFPVTIFTCDDIKQIQQRLSVQLSTLDFLCNEVQGSKMQIIPGRIYIVCRDTGKITEAIEVKNLMHPKSVEIKIKHLKEKPSHQFS